MVPGTAMFRFWLRDHRWRLGADLLGSPDLPHGYGSIATVISHSCCVPRKHFGYRAAVYCFTVIAEIFQPRTQ